MKKKVMIVLFFACFVLAIAFGASNIDLSEIVAIFARLVTFQDLPEHLRVSQTIVFSLRLPRILVVCLAGAALAAAGVVSQGLFRNSLASPTIIGTSSGGMFFAAAAFYFSSSWLHWYVIPLAAFLGSAVSTFFIFRLAAANHSFHIGFALNAFLASLTSLMVSLLVEDYQKATSIFQWLLGGFSARGYQHFFIGLGPIILALILSWKILPSLNVLALGEEIAESLAVDIIKLKKTSILIIALLVGTVISIAGAIPFIGLVVPHITRSFLGPEHKQLTFYSIINGMSLTLLADLAARTLRAPLELEVGLLTSLLGAPFFLGLLLKKREIV